MKIILASKSGVRKKILNNHNFETVVEPSNVDEDQVKDALRKSAAQKLYLKPSRAQINKSKYENPDQLVLGG